MKTLIKNTLMAAILFSTVNQAHAIPIVGAENTIIQCNPLDSTLFSLTLEIKNELPPESKFSWSKKHSATYYSLSGPRLPEYVSNEIVEIDRLSTRVSSGLIYSVDLSDGGSLVIKDIDYTAVPYVDPLGLKGELIDSYGSVTKLTCHYE